MPAPATRNELLDIVRASGILDDKRLDAFLAEQGDALPEEPGDLADALLKAGLITSFQKDLLLQGKRSGFIIADRYILLDHLGSGGMGSVYLCEHKVMRRRVALKVLPPSLAKNAEYLDRFHREARAAAALDHPNIVRAHDADHDDKRHFLVMEYIEGCSLHDLIQKEGPLGIQRAADFISQAAAGLEHAHEAGLVHRDIKPENLLVDKKGTIKILDMGLALFFKERESLTQQYDASTILGTADYLAPEQIVDSHGVDIRADIYSLGLTFYLLLTGKKPYGEGTVAQKFFWHQLKAVKSVREDRADVPEGLAAIISKMIAKDRADRYQTPREVMEALAPWVRGTAEQTQEVAELSLMPVDGDATATDATQKNETLREAPVPPASQPRGAEIPRARTPIRPAVTARTDKPDVAGKPARTPKSNKRSSPEVEVGELLPPAKDAKKGKAGDDLETGSGSRGKDGRKGKTSGELKADSGSLGKPSRTPPKNRADKATRPAARGSRGPVVIAVVVGISLVVIASVLSVYLIHRRSMAANAVGRPIPTPNAGKTAGPNPNPVTPETKKADPPVKTPDPTPKKPDPPVKTPDPTPKKADPPPKVEPPKPVVPPMPPVVRKPQSFADYYPKPGTTHFYDVATFAGGTKTAVRQKWEFKDKGVIEVTAIRGGLVEGSSLLEGGTIKWSRPLSAKQQFSYRTAEGRIELGTHVKNVVTWEPILPLTAAVGDTWKWQMPNGDYKKYAILKVDTYKGQPAVVVRDSVTVAADSEIVTLHAFVQGLGEVSRTVSGEKKNEKSQLLSEVKLVEE